MESPLLAQLFAGGRPDDIALEEDDDRGRRVRVPYDRLYTRARHIAGALLADGCTTLAGAPVAFLAPPSALYVETMLGIFLAGGTAVPLSPLHTAPELAYLLANAAPEQILATQALASRIDPLSSRPVLRIEAMTTFRTSLAAPTSPSAADPALMLYTSGTTGQPKGVVLSHAAVAACCASLHTSWGWRRDDRLLHVLPLHHTHGVVVALLGGLWAGACVRFATFDLHGLWPLFRETTVFMAVPTIYAKLMEAFRGASAEKREAWRKSAGRVRLFTSGSAALPAPLFEEFRAATGQIILERYGMTEIGMALSNPLEGPRLAGAVGRELPGVTVDIVGDEGQLCRVNEPGELRVRSPQLFSGYHRDPTATTQAFDEQGRFVTGDTGLRDERGIVRLLGRTSTDVLKSGGYKLSALEIEAVLRDHPCIAEVAIVGLPDEVWGDRVTACAVLGPGQALALEELQSWAKDRLAPYKLPRALVLMPELPRNAMGKLQKGLLKETLLGQIRP